MCCSRQSGASVRSEIVFPAICNILPVFLSLPERVASSGEYTPAINLARPKSRFWDLGLTPFSQK